MALTREKKQQTIEAVNALLTNSKMTVFARYEGTPVKALQALRREARESGTQYRVIKNRLFKKTLQGIEALKDTDTEVLHGQLLYGFNDEDEVAPAQLLAKFALSNPQIEFVGAITADGQLINADDIKSLANLPTKQQLRGQLVGLIASPLSGMVGVMSGNLRSVMYVLSARADSPGN